MYTASLAVFTATSALYPQAQALAKQLNLPFSLIPSTEYDYFMILTPEYLGLKSNHTDYLPLYVDFLSAQNQYRLKSTSLRKEALIRALGLKAGANYSIIDATAGLARDSFILASFGFKVQLLERSPIIIALVQDGMKRALVHPEIAPIINNMKIIETDARDYLANLMPPAYPDLIYLDPMFPPKSKAALSKKEMQLFQAILPSIDEENSELLTTALACAKHRVVVKRPKQADNLGNIAPHFSLKGSSCRFDIYLT